MTEKPRQKLHNLLKFKQFKTYLVLLFVFIQIAGFFVPRNELNAQTNASCVISANTVTWRALADRTLVGQDEIFNVQAQINFNAGQEAVAEACERDSKDKYDFRVYLYRSRSAGNYYSPGVDIDAKFFSPTHNQATGSGFAARKAVSMRSLGGSALIEPGSSVINQRTGTVTSTNPDPLPVFLYVYVWDRSNNSELIYSDAIPISYTKNAPNQTPTPLPDLPGGIQPDTSTTPTNPGTNPDTIPFDALFFKVSIDSAKNDKFRNFYRITFDQGGLIAVAQNPENGRTNRNNQLVSFAQFDQSGGIPVKMSLGQKSTVSSIRVGSNGTYISYSKIGSQYPTLTYLSNNTHRINSVQTIGIEQNLSKDKTVCGVSVFSSTQYFCDSSKAKINGKTSGDILLSKEQDRAFPFLLNSSPSMTQMGMNADGQTLNTVLILPTINLQSDWTQWVTGAFATSLTVGAAPIFMSSLAAPPGFTYAAEPTQKVYFEVYPTRAALDAAKDNPIPDSVAEYQDVETGNTESSGKTLGETLLDFIRKVITHLLSILTSLVYYVFSFIIAPFLVAILQIQAYKDDFVSVIYPGWLILRNISNIMFIIALLAIGLGTMFRISGYQARSLVIDLILMALLINFSLVFAQGIVALADTVQSQFLPPDSRVVNALAAKLMVEPLQLLRDSTGGQGFGASTALADISKAFVLLMFAVAALFAFIAVALFLLVRLIALWVLYLLSPLAYVAYVLPQTKKYMSQWWGEFIKYAFMGAAMAFFLNMAALMAGGDFFQRMNFGEGDGFAAGAINYVLMFAQNLAVIGFMVVGMKMASKSGIVGSKAILDFAEKGTKMLTTNLAKNKAKQVYERRIEGGMLDPRAWKKSWTDSSADKTKAIKNARLQNREGKLSPSNIINKPKDSLRYAWNKFTGRGANTLLAQAEGMQDEGRILDDDIRLGKEDKLKDAEDLLPAAKEAADNLKNGKIGFDVAEEVITSIDDKMDSVTKEHKDKIIAIDQAILDQEEKIKQARLETVPGKPNLKLEKLEREMGDLQAERAAVDSDPEYVKKINELNAQKAAVQLKLDNARASGETVLDISDLDSIDSFDKQKYKDKVEGNLNKLNSEIAEINAEIEADDLRREKYGYGKFGSAGAKSITAERRAEIDEAVKKLTEQAASRSLPISLASRARRLEALKEAEKQLELIDDYDELTEMFKKEDDQSMREAILKKMAKSGGTSHLLQNLDEKYKNNTEDMQKMMDKYLGGTNKQIRYQIGAEVGKLNADNGNLAASNLVKVKDGVIQWATTAESHKAIGRVYAKKNPQDLAKMKKDDAMVQVGGSAADDTARYEMHPEYVKAVNGIQGETRIRDFRKGLSQSHAKALIDSDNFHHITNDQIIKSIREAAGEQV